MVIPASPASCWKTEGLAALCFLFIFCPPPLLFQALLALELHTALEWASRKTWRHPGGAEEGRGVCGWLRVGGGWERDGGGGRGATSGREERARRRWKGSNTFMSGLTDGLNLLSCADGDQQRGKQKRRWNKSSSAQFHAGLKVVFSNPAALGVDRPGGSQKWERAWAAWAALKCCLLMLL